MTQPRQSLDEFLDQSFARFRALPTHTVESACDRVLDRLRNEPDREPEGLPFQRRHSRRYARLLILVAATTTLAVFAQRLVLKTPTPLPAEPARVVTVPQIAPTVQEAPKPSLPPAAQPRVEFAAASIKRMPPETMMAGAGLACRGVDGTQRVVLTVTESGQRGVNAPMGRCVGNGFFLSTIVEMAYGVSPKQISGGPDWSRLNATVVALGGRGGAFAGLPVRGVKGEFSWYRDESFQLEAIADNPSTATLQELRQMLRAMLADRFKLQFHLLKKEIPGYSLVVAERGHKLKPISGEYVESLVLYQGRSTMDRFAHTLSSFLWDGTPIVDKTGLRGAFEYVFEWTPSADTSQRGEGGGGGGVGGGRGGPQSVTERAENLSNLLEAQLGLRLQAEKAIIVDFMVIDRIEMPSAN